MKTIIRCILAIWMGVMFLFGAAEVFVRPPGIPPIPILIGVAVPLAVFLAAYRGSAAFRAFVLAIHPLLTTTIQAWRAAGFGFLALYAYGVLPGVFAWPAGLGDIAIGVTAPWVALALIRRPGFANSRLFVVWNLLGMELGLDSFNGMMVAARYLGGRFRTRRRNVKWSRIMRGR